jgi:hypothetical protein
LRFDEVPDDDAGQQDAAAAAPEEERAGRQPGFQVGAPFILHKGTAARELSNFGLLLVPCIVFSGLQSAWYFPREESFIINLKHSFYQILTFKAKLRERTCTNQRILIIITFFEFTVADRFSCCYHLSI